MQKFNCIGCHIIDLPEIAAVKLDEMEVLKLGDEDHPQAFELLMKLKPPRKAVTKQMHVLKTPNGTETLPVMTFKGLPTSRPKPDDEPEEREYGYDLWETLDLNEKIYWAPYRIIVPEPQLVSEKPARGGAFAGWLVADIKRLNKEDNAWQMSPPPLYLEGLKVQTPWLYSFLKNPAKIRHTTVLRMPRFNMSDAEAQALANYFAAYDGTPYPYQNIPQRQPAYLDAVNTKYHEKHPQRPGDYLQESWRVLNAPICNKCHSVGGNEYKGTDPKKDIRGPNLDQVSDRLRPDWVMLWLYKPSWITPYTAMPPVFSRDKKQFEPLMDGDPGDQVISARDALMNYAKLLEREGKLSVAAAPDVKGPDKAASTKEGAK